MGGAADDGEVAEPTPGAFPLLQMFSESPDGQALESKMREVIFEFGATVLSGQMLEAFAKLLAPASHAGDDDDEAAQARVAAGLKRSFYGALEAFTAAAPPDPLTDDLAERLHAAREERNALVHGWFGDGCLRAMTGDADEVIVELRSLRGRFDSLAAELLTDVFVPAMAKLGVSPQQFAVAADGFTTLSVQQPGVAAGLTYPDGADEWVARMASALSPSDGAPLDPP